MRTHGSLRVIMSEPTAKQHKALRLIVIVNAACMLLVAGMMWVSWRKTAATIANRTAYLPMDAKVRDLIESERDIEKLRSIARIENIGASGSMESLLSISKKTVSSLLPGLMISTVSLLVAAVALRKPGKPADSE